MRPAAEPTVFDYERSTTVRLAASALNERQVYGERNQLYRPDIAGRAAITVAVLWAGDAALVAGDRLAPQAVTPTLPQLRALPQLIDPEHWLLSLNGQ